MNIPQIKENAYDFVRYAYNGDERLTEKLAEYMSINEGTIYPILRKLKEEKFLDTYLQEESGGPPRKYYKITVQGKVRYQYLLNEWNSFNSKVKQILRSGEND